MYWPQINYKIVEENLSFNMYWPQINYKIVEENLSASSILGFLIFLALF